jgi:hypothetical protein
MAFFNYNHEWENDPELDWDRIDRRARRLSLQQLEGRLDLWKQKHEDMCLKLYRAATGI